MNSLWTYCDMPPESLDNSLLRNDSVNIFPRKRMRTTIEEPAPKQLIDKHNNKDIVERRCFLWGPPPGYITRISGSLQVGPQGTKCFENDSTGGHISVGFGVYYRCSSCRWVKRQPRINLLYKYLLSLYRTYKRTSAWRFAGCWLKKVSFLLGSLCVCLHLCVCVDNNNLLYTYQPALSSWVLTE
jgi:hypothetical protein